MCIYVKNSPFEVWNGDITGQVILFQHCKRNVWCGM